MVIETNPISASNNGAFWKIQELLHQVEPDVGEIRNHGFRRFKLLLPSNHPKWARSWQKLWTRAQDAERDRHGYFSKMDDCGVLYIFPFPPGIDTETKLKMLETFASSQIVSHLEVAVLIGVNGQGFAAVCRRPFLLDGKGFGNPKVGTDSGMAKKLDDLWRDFLAGEMARPEASASLQEFRSIEDLLAAIRLKNDDWGEPTHDPCPADDIQSAEEAFRDEFGHDFPAAYKRILALTNGVYFDGMTIWPAMPEPGFEETILQANRDLRETFSGDFIYFGQNGEELFVLNPKTGCFCAIEFVGKPVWAEFADADEMFRFMLERNLQD